MEFYIATLLVYLGVDIIACLGLNLQFGVTGIINFAFVMFEAAGAYVAAVLTLGPSTGNGGFQSYILGANLPFPVPILAAAAAGAIVAGLVGLIVLRRLRADYQAMVMLVVSVIATTVVTNARGLFNGANGVSTVPMPVNGLSIVGDQWAFVGVTAVACLGVAFVVRRITRSPLGMTLRAVRDNEMAAAALGKNVKALRLLVFVVGGAIAGVAGALLVEFISAWSPGSWLFPETFVFFSAVIVGGAGNNLGAAVGALLVPVLFFEATQYLPPIGYPGLIDALQWVVVGLLTLIVLWFRPQGVIPERPRRFAREGAAQRGRVSVPASEAPVPVRVDVGGGS